MKTYGMRLASKTVAVLIIWGLALLSALGLYWFGRKAVSVIASREGISSALAFEQSYLSVVAGKPTYQKTKCQSCHARKDVYSDDLWATLESRFELQPQEWAQKIQLAARCGSCHLLPDPNTLGSKAWIESIDRMQEISELRGVPILNREEKTEVLHYYFTFAPRDLPRLEADPEPKESPLRFERSPFGNPLRADWRERPVIGHIQLADLDRDAHLDLLVCDTDNSRLTWVHQTKGHWIEDPIATLPCPAHTEIITNAQNGTLNIIVACQKVMQPTDDPVGSVVLLENNGKTEFTPRTLLENISRISDVQPADLDADGDIDFVVAAYGYLKEGELGWLENKDSNYSYHQIIKRTGAIHVPALDLDGDNRMDFVALFAQEHEQISAFLNRGKNVFEERTLFKAAAPSYGSSGLELIDLDQDGDKDILYTNGDNMDLKTVTPRPYHGVQWLENKGNLEFIWHDIYRFYGAYSTATADLNADGKIDIVVTSMFNDWEDPKRASLVWLENRGSNSFKRHAIARHPTSLIPVAVADFDEDGRPDLVASGMHAFPPFDRVGRLTLWRNLGPAPAR